MYGNPDFQPTAVCSDSSVVFSDFCAEAGVSNTGPDGAGSTCTSNAQCPIGYVCGYFTNEPCASTGTCVYADFNNDPTCSPTTFCACDGTQTEAWRVIDRWLREKSIGTCGSPCGTDRLRPNPTETRLSLTCRATQGPRPQSLLRGRDHLRSAPYGHR